MSNTRRAWKSKPEVKALIMARMKDAFNSQIDMLSKSIAWTEVSIAAGAELSVEEIDRYNQQVKDLETLIKSRKELLEV